MLSRPRCSPKAQCQEGRAGEVYPRPLIPITANDSFGNNSGSAYHFERNQAGEWSEMQQLTYSQLTSQDSFGCSVSMSGDHAVIGA